MTKGTKPKPKHDDTAKRPSAATISPEARKLAEAIAQVYIARLTKPKQR
jgi:hypothetical protein